MSAGYDEDFGSYQASGFTQQSNQDYHESQLNAGETLLMVSPGGGTPGQLAAGSVLKGPPADYGSSAAMDQDSGFGGMIDYNSDPAYSYLPPNSHGGPVSAMGAPAVAYHDDRGDRDSGNGFMPPPPGFVPPPPGDRPRSSASAASANSAGLASGKSDAPASPARSQAPAGESRQRQTPSPTMSQQQPPYREAYGDTGRKQPAVSAVPASAPARSSASQAKPSRPAAESDEPASVGAPKKAKKADLLYSEVANKSSKKNRNDNGNVTAGKKGGSETQRVPWWKGGMFRNKKHRDADDGKPAGKTKNKKSDKGGK